MDHSEFAGYSIAGTIGRGGFATVYKAVNPDGETVAVKVLNTEITATSEILERFRREFEVTRKVSHPGIVKYYDFGVEQGLPYLVMEFVQGTTLWNQVRRKGPMLESEVIELADRLGSALDACHRLNILHRDVKPNNVIVSANGDAKLMDYGLVKDMKSTLNLTDEQAILGTPFFMAPEQFFDAHTVDHSSDIYGLAATLYYALTARIPFKFRGVGLLEKKLSGQFQPPDESIPNVSEEIIRAISQGLAPTATKRPETAGELANLMRAGANPDAKPAPKPAGPGGIDRRSVVRRSCNFLGTCCLAADDTEGPAQITDISTEGICLVVGQEISLMNVLQVSFCFIDEDDAWDYHARVVGVRKSAAQEWRHGCRFVQPMEEAEFMALMKEDSDKIELRVSG